MLQLLRKWFGANAAVPSPASRPASFRPELEALEERRLLSATSITGPVTANGQSYEFRAAPKTFQLQYENVNTPNSWQNVPNLPGWRSGNVAAVSGSGSATGTTTIAVFTSSRKDGELIEMTFNPAAPAQPWSLPQDLNLKVSSFVVTALPPVTPSNGCLISAVEKADGKLRVLGMAEVSAGNWEKGEWHQGSLPPGVESLIDIAATTAVHVNEDGSTTTKNYEFYLGNNRHVYEAIGTGFIDLGGQQHRFRYIQATPDASGDGVIIYGSSQGGSMPKCFSKTQPYGQPFSSTWVPDSCPPSQGM